MSFSEKSFLHCPPDYFDVFYEINPWMHITERPEASVSEKQWLNLIQKLQSLGADCHVMKPVEGLPDLVYTANAGLVRENKVVLGKFRHPERQGEEKPDFEWFSENGFEIFEPKVGFFEGEGDAFIVGDRLFAGYGFRSSKDAYPDILKFLGINEAIYCELVNPNFYHLDTCFFPIENDLALIYEKAFTEESLEAIKNSIQTISVSDHDAHKFVCNAVKIDSNVILSAGCTTAYQTLEDLGYKTHPLELYEFMKGGGSAKCMSLKLYNA